MGELVIESDMESPSQPFRSRPVRIAYEFDAGPGAFRIGLLALSTSCVTERDFMNMRPSDDVLVCTSRVRNMNPCTVENLKTMAPLIAEATSLLMPDSRLDVVAYDCTSGTVVIGFDEIRAGIHKARPGIPCVTPVTAGLAAFAALNVSTISVLTPYLDQVNEPLVHYLQSNGLAVVQTTSFQLADDNEMAALPPEVIYRAALEADSPDAQALFISCTAIRAVDAIAKIEAKIGKPVVTSNQAMFWQSLRLCGNHVPIVGFGQLLARL